ncbi:hypothetical protein [Aeromicrobium ginsengisoli]|uniref:Uncharacterized protein n=1 Tax=Aeromicrobium ginsengisoli TaxID=363867 RepID=A0A5M4FHP0_9ACTN|nr:hypothetical protein [Aeromicrobium ginsengisoli]KAA1399647.1 hypothetical protein ESP70_002480 [Aeromicrobium ginsengisoli]
MSARLIRVKKDKETKEVKETRHALTDIDKFVAVALYDLGYDTEYWILEKTEPKGWAYEGSIRHLAGRVGCSRSALTKALGNLKAVGVILSIEQLVKESAEDAAQSEPHDYRYGRPSGNPHRAAATIRIVLRAPLTDAGDDEGREEPLVPIVYSADGYVTIDQAAFWEHRRHGGPRQDPKRSWQACAALLTILASASFNRDKGHPCFVGTAELAARAGTNVTRFMERLAAVDEILPGLMLKTVTRAPNRSNQYFLPSTYFVRWTKVGAALEQRGFDVQEGKTEAPTFVAGEILLRDLVSQIDNADTAEEAHDARQVVVADV